MDGEKLLTVEEAATRAEMSETGIYSAISRGKLPFEFQYGRKLLRPSDVDAYKAKAKKGRPRKDGDEAGD